MPARRAAGDLNRDPYDDDYPYVGINWASGRSKYRVTAKHDPTKANAWKGVNGKGVKGVDGTTYLTNKWDIGYYETKREAVAAHDAAMRECGRVEDCHVWTEGPESEEEEEEEEKVTSLSRRSNLLSKQS